MPGLQIRIVSVFLLLGCIFTGDSFAATIHLKDGRKVECKVLEKHNEYVTVDYRGVILIYFNKEVDKLVDNEGPNNTAESLSPLTVNNDEVNDELLNRSFYVLLVSSEKLGKSYRSGRPAFSLRIPEYANRSWSFFRLRALDGKFYVVDEGIFSEVKSSHPRIDCLIHEIHEADLHKTPQELFKTISDSYQRENVNGDKKIINNGSFLADINGAKAFERLEEVVSQDMKRDSVFMFFDKYFLVVQLNTKTANFVQDQKDFLGIVNSFRIE